MNLQTFDAINVLKGVCWRAASLYEDNVDVKDFILTGGGETVHHGGGVFGSDEACLEALCRGKGAKTSDSFERCVCVCVDAKVN